MMFRKPKWLALLGLLLLPLPSAHARELPLAPGQAAVASAHPLATAAGQEILQAGGNAFDAAVAVAAALAVAEPYSSGLGGGGFFLLHDVKRGREIMLDARETAPAAATRDMFLDAAGNVVPGLSLNGAKAAAIPGLPAALVEVSEHYGQLPLARVLAPAIRIAREGFLATERYRVMAGVRRDVLRKDPTSAAIFLQANDVPAPGQRLPQPALARTLEAIATHGKDGFYAGDVARLLVAGVRAAGGLWTMEDLAAYRVKERTPVVGSFHGIRIVSAPPPSSGGVALIEALNVLEPYDLPALSKPARTHLIIEAMRRAYRDRAEYLGDPDFVQVPVANLINKDHAKEVSANLSLTAATASSALRPITPPAQGDHTTHLSVLDAEGNRVAATLSINYPFGSAFTPPDTGVLLNDEMDDFSSKPNAPNGYGLVGVEANAIAPGKRPLSSMTPTFLEAPNRIGILGTPGGSRIISMVLLGVLSFSDGLAPADWVAVPRFHHQYLPDEVLYEPAAMDAAMQAELSKLGHKLSRSDRDYGNMQAILWDRDHRAVSAASDPRGEGTAAVLVVAPR